jgi:DNA-binding transcriptional MocR family regulator
MRPLRKITAGRALASGALNYGEPRAMRACARCWHAAWLISTSRCTAAQIITTVGATQALDIVSRTLLKAIR